MNVVEDSSGVEGYGNKRRRLGDSTALLPAEFEYKCPFCNNLMDSRETVEAGGWRRVPVHPKCKRMIENTYSTQSAVEEMVADCARHGIRWHGTDLGGPFRPGQTLHILVPPNAPDNTDYVEFDEFGYVPLRQRDMMGRRHLRFTVLGNILQFGESYLEGEHPQAEINFFNEREAEFQRVLDDAIVVSRYRNNRSELQSDAAVEAL